MASGYNILLIEDDAADAELVELELNKMELSYHLQVIATEEELRETLGRGIPDLVISDYNLGDFTGIDAFDEIQDQPTYIPFVLLSGFIGKQKAVEVVQQGIDDYIMKDNLVRLQSTIPRLLDKIEERRKQLLQKQINDSLFNTDMHSIAVVGKDLSYTFVNDSLLQLSGYTEEALIGNQINEFRYDGTQQKVIRQLTSVIESGEPITAYWSLETKDGKHIDLHVTITQVNAHKETYGIIQARDVTHERRDERLRTQTEQISGMAGWEYDIRDGKGYHTPTAFQIYGLDPSTADKPADFFINCYEESSQKRIREAMENAVEKQQPYDIEVTLPAKDGEDKVVKITGRPITDGDRTVKVVGTMQDVTKEVRQQETLETLSMVASETHNIVLITDPQERIEWVNEAFYRNTGYTQEEVIGKNPGDLLQGPQTNPETVRRIAQKVDNEEPFTEDILNYTKDGTPYWINLSVTPLKDENGNVERFFSIQEDITQRKQAQQALERERDRLAEAQEIGKIGDWYFDASTEQITWSDTTYKIYERDPQKGPPSYNELLKYLPEDTERLLEKSISGALRDGIPYSFDTKLITGKGNKKFVHLEGKPIKDEDGEVTKLQGIAQDITKRKNAELKLERKATQLRNIADNIGGIIMRYRRNSDGSEDIIYLSDGVRELYELPKEQVKREPKKLWNIVLEEDIEAVKDAMVKSTKTLEPWHHKWRIETPSGQLKWLEGHGTPQQSGNGSGSSVQWDIIVTDITEEKKLERQLQQEVELTNSILESLPGIFFIIDKELNFVRSNQNVVDLFGLDTDTLETINMLSLFAENEQEKAKKAADRVFKDGYAELKTVLNANGRQYHYYMNGRLMQREEDPFIVGTGIDITEQIEAQQKNKILLQEIHHRVKNNLAIVSGLLDLELIENEDICKEPLRRSINRIHSIGAVHELLYQSNDLSNINIQEYVAELTERIFESFNYNDDIASNLEIIDAPMNINGAIPLGMLLNELLANSFKYAFDDNEKGEITISISKEADKYMVHYYDDGKGFNTKQFEESDTLSLTVTKLLLEQLDAEYEIDSEDGFSIKFSFQIKENGSHSNIQDI